MYMYVFLVGLALFISFSIGMFNISNYFEKYDYRILYPNTRKRNRELYGDLEEDYWFHFWRCQFWHVGFVNSICRGTLNACKGLLKFLIKSSED